MFGLYIILLLLLFAGRCSAQGIADITPDCCLQIRPLQGQITVLTNQLRDTRTILDSTRAVSARVIGRADTKIRGQQSQIDTLNAQVATLPGITAERDKLRGKTWAGRTLRKLRNGLAWVGGVVVVVGVPAVILLR